MSDLENAVFAGQIAGLEMMGEDLAPADINQAALNADLAGSMAMDDDLNSIEEGLLTGKVAENIASDGDLDFGEITHDLMEAQTEAMGLI